jgi:membrane protein YqaA with SNARE-associated domain
MSDLSLPDSEEAREGRRKDAWKLTLQTVAGIAGLFAMMFVLAAKYRTELESMGLWFVTRYGYAGLFAGTFAADGFAFPIPPQFYLLAILTTKMPQVPAIAVMCVSSLLAGNFGFHLMRKIGGRPFLKRITARSQKRAEGLFARYGYWAVAIGAITPFPYWLLCYAAGLYKMPPRLFALFITLRIPRLLAMYAIIRAAWS